MTEKEGRPIVINMSVSLVVLILVFLGIALRQLFRLPLKIWQIMGIGAAIVLFTGRITVLSAWMAIDWDIVFFLFGMFYVGTALEESGYIHEIVSRYLLEGCSQKTLAFVIVFGMGIFSALLMNDTLAIVGTPLLIKVAYHRRIQTSPLLIGLAFAITIGSVMSPIGNPQNLLIALEVPIESPFVTFLKYLGVPTLINLVLLYFFLLYLMRKEETYHHEIKETAPYNKRLMVLSKIAIGMVIVMIGYNILASFFPIYPIPLPGIALIPALFLMIFGPKRKEILSLLDWHTLIFFIAMFILMRSVWETSSVKDILIHPGPFMKSIPGVMAVSALASQLISNVPLVALYLPTIKQLGSSIPTYMALVAGSTVAGNFLIFGAASNLIIIQNAEKRGDIGMTFGAFAKVGIPFTIINILIYWIFLTHVV
ncbi:MAG: hypothetical protein KFB93_05305 [Simkaniaceae bacterium]|nr:MAG: hypothetical protein KFB93_05305 [Simkaniaceae bacterium]